MVMTATLKKYEVMVVLDGKSTQEERDAAIKEIADMIQKNAGKVINSQVWLEKHRMTFRIKKRTDGSYYQINFEAEGISLPKILSAIRVNEKVLRYLLVYGE